MTNRLLLILSAVLLSLAVAAACGEAETDAGGESGVAAAGDAAAAILPLETFITNINDPNHEKHARVQVKLAITPKAAAADIEADALLTARLHDRVLTLLTTKTYQQLKRCRGQRAVPPRDSRAAQPLAHQRQGQGSPVFRFRR